ncbi:sodium-coupled monocarboxylate transporter 1-like [Penaeus monodon]|uniref:sodium-coupled monocarboxylate transporter 1-like n=1 Tax=Penaeus monodon TaxID=6687 RepID=UPI0018A7C598|nr:sodium-coupled monocarboxylate transporter 1-like [Penaeus monodon]
MSSDPAGFSVADYLVFSASLAISVGIGVYQWWKSRNGNAEEFFLGGGRMSPVPVALSLVAGVVSAISILGNTSEMYYYGSQFWMNLLGVAVGGLLVVLVIIPVIYPLRLISIYEYLELRWGSRLLRKMVTVLQLANMFLYLGIALYAPSLALSSVTPIPTNISVIVLGLVCTFYASVGGAKAVVYTDTFQTLVMVVGVIVVIIQGCVEVGGGPAVWEINRENGRIEFFNMDPNPLVRHTFMTTTILGIYMSISMQGTSQAQYQRWASVENIRQVYLVMAINIFGLMVLWSLINFAGLVVFAVYADCDPFSAGWIQKIDQVTAYFVVDKLGYLKGIPGLFVAAVYSGVLSSVSSHLNAMAAMLWEDLLLAFRTFKNYTPTKAKNANIIISMLIGVLSTVLGVLAGKMGGLVQVAYSIAGGLGGPISGVILTGVLCPWVKAVSAISGFLCGVALNLWIVIGNFLYAPPTPLLPLSTEGCPGANATAMPFTSSTAFATTTADPGPSDPAEVFPLYLLSYCLFGAIGVLSTIVMSNLATCVFGVSKKSDVLEKTVNKTSLKIYLWMTSKSDSSSLNDDTESGSKMGDFGISKESITTSKPDTGTGEKRGIDNPVTVDDSI